MIDDLLARTRQLSDDVDAMAFAAPVHTVYNPLAYARAPHEDYLRRYGAGAGRVVFLGMNPGPWGMAQTGVPFGEIAAVRDWMGLTGTVTKPAPEHPKRPITGFDTARSEVSGRRLWSWAAERWGTAEAFFKEAFVVNWCPLVFMEEGGRNRVPEKLPAGEFEPLRVVCDAALVDFVAILKPRAVIGVGVFAESSARRALSDAVPIGRVLHPSPASPAANRGWARQADAQLKEWL